jgi:hypothetical protein
MRPVRSGAPRRSAAATRVVVSGLSATAFFGFVATIAHQQHSAASTKGVGSATSAPLPPASDGGGVTPQAAEHVGPRPGPPLTTIVTVEVHRTVFVDETGSTVPDPGVASSAPPPAVDAPPLDATTGTTTAPPAVTTVRPHAQPPVTTHAPKPPNAPSPVATPAPAAPPPVAAPAPVVTSPPPPPPPPAPKPTAAPKPTPAPPPPAPPCQGSKCV